MTEIEQESKPNSTVDVDNIIERLLEVRGTKPGQQVQLAEHEIRYLCAEARAIFIKQPILLELEAPIKVCLKNEESEQADMSRVTIMIDEKNYLRRREYIRLEKQKACQRDV